MEKLVRSKALLKVDFNMETYDLYLPEDVWKRLIDKLHTNNVTVTLRMFHELTIGERDAFAELIRSIP